jgi:hypothetical protein
MAYQKLSLYLKMFQKYTKNELFENYEIKSHES